MAKIDDIDGALNLVLTRMQELEAALATNPRGGEIMRHSGQAIFLRLYPLARYVARNLAYEIRTLCDGQDVAKVKAEYVDLATI